MSKQAPNKFILILLGIIAMAFILRVLACGIGQRLDKDALLYISMAENVADGKVNDAFLLNPRIPPLYVFLMASVKNLGMGYEKAGIMISLISGTLLLFPVYFIAKKITDEKIALIATFLVATHPYMIRISAEVMRDSLFIALILSALAFAVLSADRPFSRLWYISGVFAGLACMTRDEGIEIFLAFSAWSVFEILHNRGKGNVAGIYKRQALSFVCLLAGYLLVTVPVVKALEDTASRWNIFDTRLLKTDRHGFLRYLTTPL